MPLLKVLSTMELNGIKLDSEFLKELSNKFHKELKELEGVVGRRPSYKMAVKESNWKTYWGSNKHMKELYATEPKENFERDILICAPTKKLLTYYELKYQILYEVLEKPDEYFNDNILGKFFTKDFDV